MAQAGGLMLGTWGFQSPSLHRMVICELCFGKRMDNVERGSSWFKVQRAMVLLLENVQGRPLPTRLRFSNTAFKQEQGM